jgi:hypothetical protein
LASGTVAASFGESAMKGPDDVQAAVASMAVRANAAKAGVTKLLVAIILSLARLISAALSRIVAVRTVSFESLSIVE